MHRRRTGHSHDSGSLILIDQGSGAKSNHTVALLPACVFMFGGQKKLVMCQACRALIDPSTKTCPLCGKESVPPLRARASEVVGGGNFFSLLILSINMIMFILMAFIELRAGGEMGAVINGPSNYVLIDFGGRWIPSIQNGQWWLLVTPIFLHIGIAHLMFNSVALYYIGPQVEEALGSQKFVFIYLATGILGNIASFVFNIYGAGASGAIFGLIGLMAVYGYRMGGSLGRALMRQMIIWAGIGMVFGLFMGADNVNHFGGLISGAALGFLITLEEPGTQRKMILWNAAAVVCAGLIAASFVMVALNYGKFQDRPQASRQIRGIEQLKQLATNADRLQAALIASFNWKSENGDDPGKVAAKLRSAASDFDRVASFDSTSDQIRKRLSDLAVKRAGLFDSAETNPAAMIESNKSDQVEMDEAIRDLSAWFEAILDSPNRQEG